jgi:bifunctional DNA-binding transcriptional regulator/antitoxin component of YhaV-PrlF toxin-antitoxin module
MTTNQYRKEVTKIFKSGSNSSTIVIPKQIARKSHLDEPCHVVIERIDDGIIIRKLVLGD